jgi:hypothetical protein
MGEIQRALRRRRTIITIVVGLLLVIVYLKLQQLCVARGVCSGTAEDRHFIAQMALLFLGVIALLSVPFVLYARAKHKRERGLTGFKHRPWEYDRKVIVVIGSVEIVFRTYLQEKLKRKAVDLWRKLTANNDPGGRFTHQRFLITSPMLKPGKRLMVYHNISYGKLSLKKGVWLRIQGEYIHHRGLEWTWFGKRLAFYGRVHKTHVPSGSIEVLEGTPLLTETDVVRVIVNPVGNRLRT